MSNFNLNVASIQDEALPRTKLIPIKNSDIPYSDSEKITKQSIKKNLLQQLNLFFDKAVLSQDCYFTIRFLHDSLPKIKPKFYLLSDIFSNESAVLKSAVNNIFKRNLQGYRVSILPCTLNSKNKAKKENISGSGVIVLDIDSGNISEKVDTLIKFIGIPTLIVKSGGLTDEGEDKLHVYYKLKEFQTGESLEKLIQLRGDIASAIEADTKFYSSTQIISLLGTINTKYNNKPIVEIDYKLSPINLDKLYSIEEILKKAEELFAEHPVKDKEKIEKDFGFGFTQLEPVENMNDGEVYDYLNSLKPDVFAKGKYELWLKALFATHHQYQGNNTGKEIFTNFSLQDKSRTEKEILDSVNRHWHYSKDDKYNQKLITFRSIIELVDNTEFVKKELVKKNNLGTLVEIFSDNELYDEDFILTSESLCIKIVPKGKNALPPYLKAICSHIKVLGSGNGSKGTAYRLIRYIDIYGNLVENLLAVSLKGQELQTYLSEINLKFNAKYFQLIYNYIHNSKAISKQINIIHKLGWNEDQSVYSLAYKNEIKSYFVDKDSKIKKAYLEFGAGPDEYLRKKGSLENWKELIRLAKGNDSMILSLGLPFASIWLTPLDEAGRIIHFFGESQKGKSSLLSLSSSVFGITTGLEDYSHWLNTGNSVENSCKIRNDSILVVDELHKLENKAELPHLPYKITGGIGKVRMAFNQTTNNNRPITTWKVLTISSGEKSYPDELSACNLAHHYKGGMMNRWCDFPVVTEEFGVFSTLHEFLDKFKDPKIAAEKFRNHIVSLAKKNKGQAMVYYLEYIFEIKGFEDVFIEIKNQFEKWLNQYFYNNPKINDRNASQEMSVAKMFALSAAALKIAADANIVDYSSQYIFEVLGRCFNKFLANKVDVEMSAEDRILKKKLITFLNNDLHRSFYDNSSSNYNFNNAIEVGIKIKEEKNENYYGYYVDVGKWGIIFKGDSHAVVKSFLKNNGFILANPKKSSKEKVDYTYEIHHKGVGKKTNFNKLDLVKLGMFLSDDPTDPNGGGTSKSETENIPTEHLPTDNGSTTDINSTKETTAASNTAINYELVNRNDLTEFLQKAEKSITYGLDIETTGLRASTSEIALLQIYHTKLDKVFIYRIIDNPLTDKEKGLLSEINFVAHNASFERSFMPYLKNLNCSMIAYHASTSNRRCSIGDLSSETGIVYDNKKAMQTSDWKGELTEEQLEYAAKDAKATFILWEKYKNENKPVYERMLKASFIIDDYARRGLPVDVEALNKLRIETESKRDELLQKLTDLGFEDVITPNRNIRTKKEVMDRVTPDVMKIVEEARKTNSLINNIIKGVESNMVDGRLPINVLICGTETGRLSTVNPNVQNFPRSGFRHIFKARDGYRFVRADFSGQELRMVAAMSNEKVLIEAFNAGKDPHAIMAARLNNMPLKTFLEQPKDWQKSERQKAKAANFGFLYGMGPARFIETAKRDYGVDLTFDEATSIKNKFWTAYSFLKKWSDKERAECNNRGYALTRGGRKRHFEDMGSAYCEMINTAVQGSCGEVLLETLIALPDYLKNYLVNTVHDELIFEVPIELVEDEARYTELKNHITGAMITGVSKVEKRYPTLNITEIKDSERLDNIPKTLNGINTESVNVVLTNEPNKFLEKDSVPAKQLHKFLEIDMPLYEWVEEMIKDLEFKEDIDYITHKGLNHLFTYEAALEIGMFTPTKKGGEVREYVIECEEKLIKLREQQITISEIPSLDGTAESIKQFKAWTDLVLLQQKTERELSDPKEKILSWIKG